MDKTCFVIGPIGDEGSVIRQHADWVLDGIINPALAQLELGTGVRSDKITSPGMIDSQVISNVLDADLVIADLTLQNANAFYELALRHMAEKPTIHLIKKAERKQIPFDVLLHRTVLISWDTPEEMHRSIQELKAFIEAAISSDHDVDNPVTRARGKQRLKETATPTEQVLMGAIDDLNARVADLERRPTVPSLNALAGAAPFNALAGAAVPLAGFPVSGFSHTWTNALRAVTSEPIATGGGIVGQGGGIGGGGGGIGGGGGGIGGTDQPDQK